MTNPSGHPATLETAQIYARFRATGHIFRLENNAKDESFRSVVKNEMECPLPDCESRDLTLVLSKDRRDHLRHLTGGGHDPESLLHYQGKLAVQEWVRTHYRYVTAELEVATLHSERRADVMLTFPGGEQMAVEVQYSPITASQWLMRTESYESLGITPVWLFGGRHHFRQQRTEPGLPIRVETASIAEAVQGHSRHMLWIDPVAGHLWSHTDAYRYEVDAEPLSSVRLTTAGIDQKALGAACPVREGGGERLPFTEGENQRSNVRPNQLRNNAYRVE